MTTNKKLGGKAANLLLVVCLAAWAAGCSPSGPSALLKGKKLIERGRYPEAVEKLTVATQLLATNAHAWSYLGLACHHAGRNEEAEAAYERALKLDRNRTEVYYNLGCLLLEENRNADARSKLTAFTLQQNNSAAGLLKLGTAQLRLRDLAGAEKSFNEVLKAAADNPEAMNGLGLVELQRNRLRDAGIWFNRALEKQPNYGPALLNQAIMAQTYSNDPKLAAQKYKAYLALKPRPANWEPVNAVARQLEQEFNPQPRTIPAPTQPAPVNPTTNAPRPVTNAPARPPAVNTPRVEAPASSSRVTTASPPKPAPETAPPARTEIVQVPDQQFVRVGENVTPSVPAPSPPKAVTPPARELSTISEPVSKTTAPTAPINGRYAYLSPPKPAAGNRAEAERLFALASQAQRNRRAQDALTQYRAATQADPSFFEAQANLGLAEYNLKDWPQALAAYETALAIKPDSFSTRFNFALALQNAGYLQDAAQELERATAASPAGEPTANLVAAHLMLARLYAKQFNRPASARPHFLKVLELDPTNMEGTSIRYWLRDNP